MHQYKELKVWQKSIDFAVDLYQSTRTFPKEELYGMTSQLNRAVISIGSNIAEGAGRNSDKEFLQFLSYAYGSTCEVDTQLIIASRLKMIELDKFKKLQNSLLEIQKMLFSLKSSKRT